MSDFSTLNSAKAHHLDVLGVAPDEIIPGALILAASTKAGDIEGDEPAIRVPFIETDDDPGFVAEGDVIPEGDPQTREVVIHTGKIAQLEKITREQWRTGASATMLDESMRRAMTKKANWAFLSQPAPTGGDTTPPAGLLNLGITNGGTIAGDLDEIDDAIMAIEEADGHATNIIASPRAWASLVKLKTATDSNVSLVGAGTEAAERTLRGVPVLVTNAAPAGTLIVMDKGAVLSAWGKLELVTSEHRYIESQHVALVASWRFGIKVSWPQRVIRLTIGGS